MLSPVVHTPEGRVWFVGQRADYVASLDPEKLVEIVSEMNVLEPSTRMRVDAKNQALIVSGSGADRFITNNSSDFPRSISEVDVTYPDELPEP